MDSKMEGGEISVTTPATHEEDEAKKGFWHIDKEMIRFKIHFFLFFGAMGAMLPYSPLIAKNRIGISATSYATITTASLFSTILTKTALGYVADYFKRMKIMISVLIIMHCSIYLSLLFIPPIMKTARMTQNDTLSDYFKDYKVAKLPYHFLIISYDKNANCDAYNNTPADVKFAASTTTEVIVTLEGQLGEIVCFISHINSVVNCFEANSVTKKDTMKLKPQNTFCCSIYSSKFEKFHSLPFRHSSIAPGELAMAIRNSNISFFQCSLVFSGLLTELMAQESVNDFKTYQFWIYALLMFLVGTCASSTFTLSDTICCESVQKYKRDFGRQRIYSAISWGLLAPLGGLLCDFTNDFYATWLLMVSLQCLTIWNLYKMDIVIPQFSQNIAKDVATILKSPTFLAYQLGVFINGVGSGITWFYLIWFVSSLGANNFLCGMIPYMQCFAGELPIMFYSGWIIEKLGHFNINSLSLLFYAIRFLCYSYLQNPWLVLPVEITQGFNYGLFYPAVASFGKLSAKTGTEATTQSILFSTHEGLGAGIGCVLAGIGFDTLGGHWTFFYFSMFAFGSTLLNICSTLLVRNFYTTANPEPSPPKE
ncbi:major facilitator superfamily domain-containing protein 6 [Parasteatoda tepidariorum]|uniref:major facilitator superfamily domain-containing protein 6 n=1 Tax=Parasteatoda tepidariorum TaxID=114398 RepID=UPI00077FCDA4|nr:major facilitator superfamily domain-containing protein 6 [Parasteatoda tepidariorum]